VIDKLTQIIPAVRLCTIYKLPFVAALHKGTLPRAPFEGLLGQDRLYLRDLSIALKEISQRLVDKDEQALFDQLSKNAFKTHLHLHDKYLLKQTSPAFFHPPKLTTTKIPIIYAYTNHQLEAARHGTIEEAIASVLPCFVIYSYLGLVMQEALSPGHPYYLWIKSFASPHFLSSTLSIIELTEKMDWKRAPLIAKKVEAALRISEDAEAAFFNYYDPSEAASCVPSNIIQIK
jgi:thiaminase (transcriptional activator TenA)